MLSGSASIHGDSQKSAVKPSNDALACMINSEIGAVLAVMRRNVRWGVRYISDDQLEHSLIHSLKELRKKIFSWKNSWNNVDPALYLQPFLDVIRSDETGAPITGVSLSSVYKILTLDVLSLDIVNVAHAMHLIVDTVKSCRFEVTDPASEEVVLMKILQVLLACMKCRAASRLSNHDVCVIVYTCLRVIQQSSSKSELLQRIARHTMHELIRCIFSHLPEVNYSDGSLADRSGSFVPVAETVGTVLYNGNFAVLADDQPSVANTTSAPASNSRMETESEKSTRDSDQVEVAQNGEIVSTEPFGIPCMLEIFHFLCSLLNTDESNGMQTLAYDEDVPLFALGLINSAIELGGSSFRKHPKLLGLIQDDLFHNLMRFGMSMSPLVLSTVCSIVLNLYLHVRMELKAQIEAFLSCVLLRRARNKHGSSYQLQEVAMEALVDLCRQHVFMVDMYTNFDCDITSSNVFEELANLLSKSAFPVNEPLSAMHVLALDGLILVIQGIADRIGNEIHASDAALMNYEGKEAFWTMRCENYSDPCIWVPFVRKVKSIKKRLMIGADHFNRDPKKGLEFFQGQHLLPEELDPKSVASLFRWTSGLDKNLIGDFLGNHEPFWVQVLYEFARSFDFGDMALDTALRLFLGTFRLPGESQKIQRVLEAFAERYYEQSPQIFKDKDAALLLSYSLILLNTDQHNMQIKKKMTEEDFIRNNRHINGGQDLPREFLSELYHSICENEIQMTPDQGTDTVMTLSRWITIKYKSKETTPYIVCDSTPMLDRDMFSVLSGPTIAAMSVVFEQAEQEEVLERCIDGYLAISKISAFYNFDSVLNDLIVSLCKFTSLSTQMPSEEAILALGEDTKARMSTMAIFSITNKYGDYVRAAWKNILDCVLSLHKLDLLPNHMAREVSEDTDGLSGIDQAKIPASVSQTQYSATPKRSSSLIGRFSQLLSFDMEETRLQPTEEELAARRHAQEAVQNCHIDTIFTESKFLHPEALVELVRALISATARLRKTNSSQDEADGSVFCLELLIAILLNNRDRILVVWQSFYEHVADILQTTAMPCALVEKAVFGLLRICQRLLPYKENLRDELLKSLQLIQKLEARVADVYCEPITQEVARLIEANASHIRTNSGWRTVISLLSATARHPEASEPGFKALTFIMCDGAYILPSNFVLCVEAARQFVESRVGEVARSVAALDLMAGSLCCLARWSYEAKNAIGEEASVKLSQNIGEMWLRLMQGLRRMCLDERDTVRNHAILALQRCLGGLDGFRLPSSSWFQCFDTVIFSLFDDLLGSLADMPSKNQKKVEDSLVLATKLLSKAFLQSLQDISTHPSFCKVWLGVLNRFEESLSVKIRGKRSEKIHELIPELLKNTLLVMKTTRILFPGSDVGSDSFWQLTWLHVKKISPDMQAEVFSLQELEHMKDKVVGSEQGSSQVLGPEQGSKLIPAGETAT